MNPIQQLVDAAKEARDFIAIVECDEGLTTENLLTQIDEARAAVESAQVETRWEVEIGAHRHLLTGVKSQEEAKINAARLATEVYAAPEHRLIRIDTYRSVESDQ